LSIKSITIQHSHNKVFVSENRYGCAFRLQEVESCDCVDEETECSDARVQREERIQQVLSVAGNVSEQFAIGIITDTGESCRTLSSVTQFRRLP